MGNISNELIIKCMKFVAENWNLSYEEMKESLASLGWTYTIDDLRAIGVNRKTSATYGLRDGDFEAAAVVLANVISRPTNYSIVKDKLLSCDGELTVYEFIRKVTNDQNYTLENIQSGSMKK